MDPNFQSDLLNVAESAWRKAAGSGQAARNLRLAKEKGFEVTPEGKLVLYHATKSGDKIKQDGFLLAGSMLSADKAVCERFLYTLEQRGKRREETGEPEIIRLEVDPGLGSLDGSYFNSTAPIPLT